MTLLTTNLSTVVIFKLTLNWSKISIEKSTVGPVVAPFIVNIDIPVKIFYFLRRRGFEFWYVVLTL